MKTQFPLWQRPWMTTLVQAIVGLLALLGVIGMQRSQLSRPSLWASDPMLAAQQTRTQLHLLRQAPSFGFDNLLADWVFLQFLEYYGDRAVRQQTGYGLAPDYFDVITHFDPRFVDVYPFLSSSVSYQLGKPEVAINLMRRGTEALSPELAPNAYRVWRYKGLDQLLLLGDVAGAITSHEMAANWAESIDPQLTKLFRNTANFLREDPNSLPVRVNSWASIWVEAIAARDQQTQARAKAELAKLGYTVQINEKGQPLLQRLPSSGENSIPPAKP